MSADLFAAFGASNHTDLKNIGASRLETDGVTLTVEAPGDVSDLAQGTKGQKNTSELAITGSTSHTADVLFDASDEWGAEEEFGDFEGGTASDYHNSPDNHFRRVVSPAGSARANSGVATANLLDLTVSAGESDGNSHPTHPSHLPSQLVVQNSVSNRAMKDEDEWGTFESAHGDAACNSKTGSLASGSKSLIRIGTQDQEIDDEWEAFEDGPAIDPKSISRLKPARQKNNDLNTEKASSTTLEIKKGISTYNTPNQYPPPAILLEMLPKVFQTLRKMEEVPDSNSNLANAIIRAFVVASRIVAGRSLRWKRDAILSQSTKIGPAAAGKSRGMKLASLDKTENLKEEREASEAVAAWSSSAHYFNTVAVKSETHRPLMAISLRIPVKIISGPAVLTSNHPCALCGIQREERVSGVDIDVNDYFGEYWTEHWGHTDCANFWNEYEHLLQQR